jgi:hypothetical protein
MGGGDPGRLNTGRKVRFVMVEDDNGYDSADERRASSVMRRTAIMES